MGPSFWFWFVNEKELTTSVISLSFYTPRCEYALYFFFTISLLFLEPFDHHFIASRSFLKPATNLGDCSHCFSRLFLDLFVGFSGIEPLCNFPSHCEFTQVAFAHEISKKHL